MCSVSVLGRRALTCKPLTNSSVANKTTIIVVGYTVSQGLIEYMQVQVDSIVQVERDCVIYLQRSFNSL